MIELSRGRPCDKAVFKERDCGCTCVNEFRLIPQEPSIGDVGALCDSGTECLDVSSLDAVLPGIQQLVVANRGHLHIKRCCQGDSQVT